MPTTPIIPIEVRLQTTSAEETEALAALIAGGAQQNQVIALDGDLGAGKTAFSRGFAKALGIPEEEISSPTFTLVNVYEKREGQRLSLYHFDVYRMEDEEDFLAAGLADYLTAGGICLIEWAKRIRALLPEETLHIELTKPEIPSERSLLEARGTVDITAMDSGHRELLLRAKSDWPLRIQIAWEERA